MDIVSWLPALGCVGLILFLAAQRTSASADASPDRLALAAGTRRAFGESDESLRRRAIALSRWPFYQEPPAFVWWARWWRKLWRRADP